jgi:hypothetical protein
LKRGEDAQVPLARAAALVLASSLLAACTGDDPDAPWITDSTQWVATTPRALAWLASEHVGVPSSARLETDGAEEVGQDAVSVELNLPGPGRQVVVAVGRGKAREFRSCRTVGPKTCAETDRGLLFWELAAFESDPGVVYVAVTKETRDGSTVTVLVWSSGGDTITGDPRELDLSPEVDTLFDLAHDPGVALMTPEFAAEAGEELTYFEP